MESTLPNGMTLLHDSIVAKSSEAALFLIRHGADVSRPTNEGALPLEVSAAGISSVDEGFRS